MGDFGKDRDERERARWRDECGLERVWERVT